MIYSYRSITKVHLEMSSKCNASCPQCARNMMGGATSSVLPEVNMTLDQLQKILPEDFIKQLDSLYMCGNYGDPIVAPDMLLAYEWLRSVNPNLKLGLHTNGSARTPAWWSQLGMLFSKPGDYVNFGLDGLEDTNHIYRRGTQWTKIMENAAAFISAGGRAQWEYLVFGHNEHQVAEAEALSKEMGFRRFRVKKTGRFFSNTKLENKDRQEVKDRNGDLEYYIDMATDPVYLNNSLQRTDELIAKYGSMSSYLDQSCIKCKVAEEKNVYISAEGLVFPCCWTANPLYLWYQAPSKNEIWKLIDHDTKNVSALENSLESIIEGPYFKRIEDSWNKPSIIDGKLRVCAKTCGSDFDQFSGQFSKAVNNT